MNEGKAFLRHLCEFARFLVTGTTAPRPLARDAART